MAVTHVQQRADVRVGAYGLVSLCSGQFSKLVRKPIVLQSVEIRLLLTKVTFPDGDVEIAELQITFDAVFLNSFANDVVPCPAQILEDDVRIFAKVLCDDFFPGNATDYLPAVTPGGSPADPIRFDHVYVITAFQEMQCRRDTGETGPDYADVRAVIAPQRGEVSHVIDAGGVVGACV